MIDLMSNPKPFDYDALCDTIRRMKNDYAFLHYYPIGKSGQSKSIQTLVWGQGDNNVVYVSGISAMDSVISMCLLQFMADVCENYKMRTPFCGMSVRKLYNTARIYIVPMPNPDGIEMLHSSGPSDAGNVDSSKWIGNADGVDIRKNFGVSFEERKSTDDAATAASYGSHGESEPETQAICNLCRKTPVKKAFDFQSFEEKIYWDYGVRTAGKAFIKANKLSDWSGFALAEADDNRTKGGFIDWFVNVFAKPAFTIGLGDPKSLLDKERFQKLEEFLLKAIIA